MSRVATLARRVRNLPGRMAVNALRSAAVRRALRAVVDLPIDPYDPAFCADPYPAYRRLRERAPVYRSPFGAWFVTRYADTVAVLTDPRFTHPDYRRILRRTRMPGPLELLQGNSFIYSNPPDHTRQRRLVGQVFTPGRVADMHARITATTDRLLDGVMDAGRMDAVTDFARRLPVAVIADLLGIPPDDAVRCQTWAIDAATVIDLAPTRAQLARAEVALRRILGYFRDVVAARRAHPTDDVISGLVAVESDGGRLGDDEIVANCATLFLAGYETTVAFLGTAILTLLRDRAAWEALRADPKLIRGGIEELLRLESPIQFFGRQAQADVVLEGKRIRRGDTVFLLLGSANRDPARFPDPDRLDLHRPDNRHLAFGHGLHACFGQGLTRLEGQIALEALLRRCPRLRPGAGPPVWRANFAVRGLESLPVEW